LKDYDTRQKYYQEQQRQWLDHKKEENLSKKEYETQTQEFYSKQILETNRMK